MFQVYGVTFDHTINYGTCFQSFALKKAISLLSAGGESCGYALIPIYTAKDFPRNSLLRHLPGWILIGVNRFGFRRFEQKHMSYANCRVIAEFGRLNASADAFVCGSDVIWNPNFNNGLGAFFLDFAEKYKFSYAASFGDAEIDPQRIAPFAKALSELREIGLREQDGLRIVSALTDRPACVVADPVFLLTREDWERVAAPRGKKGGYIFTYTTHVTSEFTRFTEQLSKQTGLPVVRAVWDRSPSNRLKHGKLFSQSPERFLQQLRDADYVVTNSFHATALSLIFRKSFYTVVQGDKTGGINVRMADLLARTGMTDRIYNTVPDRIDLTAPDFTAAAETLREMREEGVAFLQRNLDAAYEEKKQSHNKGA